MTNESNHFDEFPNHYMEEFFESLSERPPSDAPYFANSTVQHLLHSSRTTNKNTKEEKAKNVLLDIPIRIRRLLCDVAVLSEEQYLEDLDQNWEHLRQVPRWSSFATRRLHRRDEEDRRENFQFNLGFDIGVCLSALTGTLSEDSRASVFLAGFTTAFSTDQSQLSHNQNDTTYDEGIEEKYEKEFKKYGVKPTQYINSLVKQHNVAWRPAMQKEQVSHREAIQDYLEERVGERFGKYSHVRRELDREWESINEASVPGMNAEEVLKALWRLRPGEENVNKKGEGSSTRIAKQAGKSSKYKGAVSQVLNRLSNEGKDPSEEVTRTFEGKEIVQYDSGTWKLTDYGQLLLYHVFVQDRDPTWVQIIAIGDSPHQYSMYRSPNPEILEKGLSDYYNN